MKIIKGIVSQDIVVCYLVSFDRSEFSEVCIPAERVCLVLKALCRVEFFLFSCLGVVRLPCEWSWAIRLSAAIVVVPDSKKALNLS
jgi:hypothetical protein